MAAGAYARNELSARPRSLGNSPLSRSERAELQALTTSLARGHHYKRRPRTVGECAELVPGPCPWVSCRFNLFIEVNEETGVTRANFPSKEIDEIGETCALRVASKGPQTLARVGELLNITEEWARQAELSGLVTIRRSRAGAELGEAGRSGCR